MPGKWKEVIILLWIIINVQESEVIWIIIKNMQESEVKGMKIQKSRKEKRSVEGYAICMCALSVCSCGAELCDCSCLIENLQVSRTDARYTTVNDNLLQSRYNSFGRTENMRA